MSSAQLASACRQIGRLFGTGTVAGLGEGQLLDRFAARRDPAAFEAIVARHGPMVLAVCRSLLRDTNDVDDAFQATFLVLVRRADSVRHRDQLGAWLHGVARRVALRARAESARRRDRQAEGPEPSGSAGDDPAERDARAAVHAEVDRLPESYRAAVVLCYFEGRTHEEAAHELGWPVGTVRGRLGRARDLLRGRLARRGVGLSSSALLASLARESEAAVPGVLLESTTKAAALAAAGPLAMAVSSSALSARALALAQGVLPLMTASKLKLAATLLAVGLLAGPGASARSAADGDRPSTAKVPEAPAPAGAQAAPEPAGPLSVEEIPDRVAFAERALRDRLRMYQAGEVGVDGLARWNQRLLGAKIDSGRDQAEAFRSYVETSRTIESIAKARFTQGAASRADLTAAQFDRMEAEDHTREVWHLPPGPIQFPLRAAAEPARAAVAKTDPLPAPAASEPRAPAAREASPPPAGPAARLKVSEEAIAAIRLMLDKTDPSDSERANELTQELRNWESTADQARHELGGPDPAYLAAVRRLDDSRKSEAKARERYESGQAPKLDYLNVQFQRIVAQEQADRMAPSGLGSGQVSYTPLALTRADAAGPSPASDDTPQPQPQPGPNPGPGPKAKGGGDSEAGAIAEVEQPRFRRLPKSNPVDADRDKEIEQILEQTASLNFPAGTPLNEILKAIRDRTKDEKAGLKKGVPIYVDPLVLIEDRPGQERKAKSLVTLVPVEIDDLPLRVALRLVLDQFSLSYQVRDRMVYVTDEDLLDFRTEGAIDFMKATGSRTPGPGGMGGGMGVMGGMIRGMGGMGQGGRRVGGPPDPAASGDPAGPR